MIKVSASVLNADLSALGGEVGRIVSAGADMLHIDVMDGIFVPPMTIGDVVVKSLAEKFPRGAKDGNTAEIVFDTHLMVSEPERVIERFAAAGSDIITVHAECFSDYADNSRNLKQTLEKIRGFGCKAGLAINPPTAAQAVFPYLEYADILVVMSVNPGYGGQPFIPESLGKIAAIKREIGIRGLNALIEVDGGINKNTAPDAVKAGADILVAGNYLFSAADMGEAVTTLKGIG